MGIFLTLLKHLGLLAFPMTNIGSLSPYALPAANPVRRILLCFPPAHFSPFKCNALFGKHW